VCLVFGLFSLFGFSGSSNKTNQIDQMNQTNQYNHTVLGVPCLTLRDNTERPETITIGTNELIGTDPGKLPPALARLMARQWKKGAIPPKWDGKAAERIVEHLERLLASK